MHSQFMLPTVGQPKPYTKHSIVNEQQSAAIEMMASRLREDLKNDGLLFA